MALATFLYDHYNAAKKAGKRYGINHWYLLAQSYAETGGNSYGLRVRKNVAGITAYGLTNQYWKGERSASTANPHIVFRIYPTIQAGWYDFARLLAEKYKMGGHKSIQAYATAISQSPYISEANGDDRAAYRANIIRSYEKLKALSDTVRQGYPVFLVILAVSIIALAGWQYRGRIKTLIQR